MQVSGPLTPWQAQAIHEERQTIEEDHDTSSCYCCCRDCEVEALMVERERRMASGWQLS